MESKLLTILCLLLAAPAQAEWQTVTVTAYCACARCCTKSDGITASGKVATEGRTAAASRSIPFGTRLYIEGLGWRAVEDRLARRFDDRVDVFFASHEAATQFGKRELKVWIESGDDPVGGSRPQSQGQVTGGGQRFDSSISSHFWLPAMRRQSNSGNVS